MGSWTVDELVNIPGSKGSHELEMIAGCDLCRDAGVSGR